MPRFHPPTPGTRIAAWVFPLVTLWLGLGYIIGPADRLQAGAYDFARSIASMWVWGLIFLTVAVIKIGCLLFGGKDPRVLVIAMCAGLGLYTCWAILIGASVLTSDASFGAPALPVGWAIMHVAFLATLTNWTPAHRPTP